MWNEVSSGVTLAPGAFTDIRDGATIMANAAGGTFSHNAPWFLLVGGLAIVVTMLSAIFVGFLHFGRR